MKLFAKGKGQAAAARPKASAFSPIDRIGLFGLLDQVVNGGQTGVLELREPRGNWVYSFQAGALTHASGGRVRGARDAFDLLWEFQSGEFTFTPGPNPSLAGNLYIDKGRLLDLLRRSQAALQGPSAPYIPPGQQRPIAPATWQPAAPPAQYAGGPAPAAPQGWPPSGQPGGPAPGQPGMPPAPSWGAGGYAQQPGYPAAPYPGAQPQSQPYPQQPQSQPYPQQPQGQPYPQQPYPQPPGPMMPAGQPQPGYPAYPQQQGMPQQGMPQQGTPPQMMPPQPPVAPAPPARPVTPPSFSVPPMAIPRKREAAPTYQPPAPGPAAAQTAPEPQKPAPPKDDLAALRASLVAQAPPVRPAQGAPAWGVRTADGTVAPAPGAAGAKGKGKKQGAKTKAESKLVKGIKVQLITFLLWACERRYSPDDHWTLKDAFEVSTMELRDQFIGAFSESFKASKKREVDDDDGDDMAAGRMRGRGRKH